MATAKAPARRKAGKAPAGQAPKPTRTRRVTKPVDFPYSTGTRHRWWKDEETERLANELANRYASAYLTPVVRLAVRFMDQHPPTKSQINWIREHSMRQTECKMTSWNGQTAELAIIRRVAQQNSLSHLDVHRLAVRLLAANEGLIEPF